MPSADTDATVRTVQLAAIVDAALVVLFVVLGRNNHDEGETVAGIASTAWPFLVGLGVGWIATRAWRSPLALVPTGAGIWVSTVAVGMVVRRIAGDGTAFAFIVVATLFLGAMLLGWRALVAARSR